MRRAYVVRLDDDRSHSGVTARLVHLAGAPQHGLAGGDGYFDAVVARHDPRAVDYYEELRLHCRMAADDTSVPETNHSDCPSSINQGEPIGTRTSTVEALDGESGSGREVNELHSGESSRHRPEGADTSQ